MHFTLCDLVADITQNAAESGAALVEMDVRETDKGPNGRSEFRFAIRDNGKGMDQDELKRAVDPFVTDGIKHPHRRVGLGIPFLIQTAEQSGGGWDLRSEKNTGTTITAWFDMENVDTPPVGDVPGLFRTVILFSGPEDMHIRRFKGEAGYEVLKSELVEALGGLEDTASLILLDKYLRSLEEE